MTSADDWKPADPPTALPVPSSSDGTPTAGGETTPLSSACTSPCAGRYTLVAEMARGGMGTIYLATDTVLGREVAVKVLLDKYEPGSAVARRFAEETRITAQLQHPAIPPVHDLGVLPDGRPFLVMKLIKGETLDELLKRRSSCAEDRGRFVAAFEQVCQAVAYAHAHDVIHRDLKPGNVMVGSFGEVQVMDWGLAKALGAKGEHGRTATDPERTTAETEIRSLRDSDGSFTQAGSVLGTPAYMAPEQAAGEVDKIDARADVFGLGAILCVLLTGRPPFEGADAERVRLNAVRGRTEAAFARLDASGAEPELIALCKRCVAFEPGDRPAAANAVASEVAELRRAADERARQAEHEKVSAEARAAEQVKRRRAVQRAAGVVAVVLLLGVVGTAVGLLRAERAKNDAEASQKVAEEKRAEADATVAFFRKNVFAAARPKGERGLAKDVTLRQAILASLPALESSFKDQPLVEAQLRLTLGITFLELGDDKSAAQQCERARDLMMEHLGPDHPHTLDSLHALARAYAGLGRYADALKLSEEIVADRTRVLGPDHRATLGGLNSLANCYANLGRTTEALRLREEVLEKRKRLLGPDDPDTLQSMGSLAGSYRLAGRKADAVKLLEPAAEGYKRVLGPDNPHTLWSLLQLATSYAEEGRYAEALKIREQVLAASRRVLDADHPDRLYAMNSLARSYAALGRHADAFKIRQEVLAVRRRILGPDHPETLASQSAVSRSYFKLGRYAEALKNEKEVLAARRRILGRDHLDTLWSMHNVTESLVELGRGKEALPLADDCLGRITQRNYDRGLVSDLIGVRLNYFEKAGDPAGCRATAEQWEKFGRTQAADLYDSACNRAITARVYAKAGNRAEAATDADRAMQWLHKAAGAGEIYRAKMEKDHDLDYLHPRDDFQKLLESLPKETKPASPSKANP